MRNLLDLLSTSTSADNGTGVGALIPASRAAPVTDASDVEEGDFSM